MTDQGVEVLTPELVLVSPDLREQALQALRNGTHAEFPWSVSTAAPSPGAPSTNGEPALHDAPTGSALDARRLLIESFVYLGRQAVSIAMHALAVIVIIIVVLFLTANIHL